MRKTDPFGLRDRAYTWTASVYLMLPGPIRSGRKPAKVAGVSHMTVSRVVDGGSNITKQTRSKVLAAIEATGYRPSAVARALVTRRAMRIGVSVIYGRTGR